MLYVQIAILLVSLYMTYAMTSKTSVTKAAFSDFDFPQTDAGTPHCVFFGDCWTGDWTVLAVGDYSTKAIYASSGK